MPRGYDPLWDDVNGNGIIDLSEDGMGQWIFSTFGTIWDPILLMTVLTLDLIEDTLHYHDQTFIDTWVKKMFHYRCGDIKEDAMVNIIDLATVTRALLTSGNPNDHHYGHLYGAFTTLELT